MYSPEEYKELFIKDNKEFAKRIKDLLRSAEEGSISKDNFTEEVSFRSNFVDDEDRGDTISIEVANTDEAREYKPYSQLPADFTFPVYTLEYSADTVVEERLISTPYGFLPVYSIGADDNLYLWSNTYFFNEQGQGLKAERWQPATRTQAQGMTLEKQIEDVGGLDIEKLVKVNVVPDKSGIRVVGLEVGDYEKVDSLLVQIESGKFSSAR